MQLDFTTHMTPNDWSYDALAYIESLPTGAQVDADNVRRRCGSPNPPNAMGALFRAASHEGLIRVVDFANSTRPTRHGSLTRLWERA
jgi:hypothetical protein